MKRLRWPPTGTLSQNDIADRETFTASNGPYSVVRSQIRYGTTERYKPRWYAVHIAGPNTRDRHILGVCGSSRKAVRLCNAHNECHDQVLFEQPKKRKGKR